ncbi:MAG: hypothetical protein NC936_03195 [Candidatus Omnitrophica bacterium]|nr:hypothetical protein [Candidatus Omnitrophota bacterium]
MFLKFKKAQAFSEYAIFIGIILAAFMAMQHYLRNSVSGKLKAGADYLLSKGQDGLDAELYDPFATKSSEGYSETRGGKHVYKEGELTESTDLESSQQVGTQVWK